MITRFLFFYIVVLLSLICFVCLKRRQYDQFGTASDMGGPGGPTGQGFGGFQGFQSNIDPEELFRNIFGDFAKGFNEQSYRTGDGFDFEFSAPQEVQLSLSFKEAAKGCTKEVKLSVIDTCPKCKGSRFAISDTSHLCSKLILLIDVKMIISQCAVPIVRGLVWKRYLPVLL